MKLAWVSINGYKRFSKPTKINLEGKLICLVGPNECGKSSILHALNHFDSGEDFIKDGINQELTRGSKIDPNQTIIEATYYLEKKDLEKIAHIKGGKSVKNFIYAKQASGIEYHSLRPSIQRNKTLRVKLVSNLERIANSKYLQEFDDNQKKIFSLNMVESAAEEEIEYMSKRENIIDLIHKLTPEDENLPKRIKIEIEELVEDLQDFIQNYSKIKYIGEFPNKVSDFLKLEFSKHPNGEALDILEEIRPKFKMFKEEDRNIEPKYILDEEDVPKALQNLSNLAELDLQDLIVSIETNNEAEKDILIRDANAKLREVFDQNWHQSGISVRLLINENVINVHVENKEDISSIAERSDGLKQFVSLLAFVTKEKANKPILLMDELENHLHYDAQADFVQMLAKQDLASQVIFSTHSVGCLPEDLGTGVRLVKQVDDQSSKVKNWFWVDKRPGFYPILFGMGAKTLAFLPIRHALFTEGATDFILLPTLFKDVLNEDNLGYQILPGLANANIEQIGILKTEANKTVFLVDSDEGGKGIAKKLKRSGILDKQIFSFPNPKKEGLVLEDFINPNVYFNAVNKVLGLVHNTALDFSVKELPHVNRPGHISDWCETKGLKPISKRAVAHAVLEERNGLRIVDGKRKVSLLALANKIKALVK